MIRTASLTVAVAGFLMTGCAGTLSGVGGTDRYGCKAPPGTVCTSVSGVYANGPAGEPSQVRSGTTTADPSAPEPYGALPVASVSETNPSAPASLRTAPRVLTLWIAPWEDHDGDLHEAANIHVLVDAGRWRTEHLRPSRQRAREVVAPVAAKPPPKDASPTTVPPEVR